MDILEQVLARSTRDPAVRGVILMGSHARGLATPRSDYDVTVAVADQAVAWRHSIRSAELGGERPAQHIAVVHRRGGIGQVAGGNGLNRDFLPPATSPATAKLVDEDLAHIRIRRRAAPSRCQTSAARTSAVWTRPGGVVAPPLRVVQFLGPAVGCTLATAVRLTDHFRRVGRRLGASGIVVGW
ncbi:nucleotidyltransferase domain-containing protein [Dactylosporangium sp. NPDC005555]|uniref:nucleotidyltransferase domain-containing protein n=1 Tax=Dactylosporangium sp. NPDC005555 TaxID=3154889 RepID=UPI0033BD8D0B